MAAPIQLYYWPTPNGWKISVALEEMGLPYEVVPVNIGKGDQFKPEFLAISPNNRMPAIVDPDGPDGQPISVFESGAILQYLGRKTGKFYPADERGRVNVEQWLMWQMGGLGPMGGQANHFRNYAPTMTGDSRHLAYGANRYTDEADRLYGVLDKQLRGKEYVCGEVSIADFACIGWACRYTMQGVQIADFPDLKAWIDRMLARPGVAAGMKVGEDFRTTMLSDRTKDADAQRALLFGQRARK